MRIQKDMKMFGLPTFSGNFNVHIDWCKYIIQSLWRVTLNITLHQELHITTATTTTTTTTTATTTAQEVTYFAVVADKH